MPPGREKLSARSKGEGERERGRSKRERERGRSKRERERETDRHRPGREESSNSARAVPDTSTIPPEKQPRQMAGSGVPSIG